MVTRMSGGLLVCKLERLIGHFVQASAISSRTLGRCSEKFSLLLRACQELPGKQEVDLDSVIYNLESDLDPYSSKPARLSTHESVPQVPPNPDNPPTRHVLIGNPWE